MQRLRGKRSGDSEKNSLLSTLMERLPGAWFSPTQNELVALYRLRCKMAMDEEKFDIALIFLNKILEVDPLDLEAKLQKGELYHRHLGDYSRAIEQYNKVIRLTTDREGAATLHRKARTSLMEIMELLS